MLAGVRCVISPAGCKSFCMFIVTGWCLICWEMREKEQATAYVTDLVGHGFCIHDEPHLQYKGNISFFTAMEQLVAANSCSTCIHIL